MTMTGATTATRSSRPAATGGGVVVVDDNDSNDYDDSRHRRKLLSQPLTLPCGAVLPNRIAKSALTEGLATASGMPTFALENLYRLWSKGGAGLLISGNIMVDKYHLERPGNVVMRTPTTTTNDNNDNDNDKDFHQFQTALARWAQAGQHSKKNHFWAQLNHAGRQVQRHVNPNPLGPSSIKVPLIVFGTPLEMTVNEIQIVQQQFVTAARYCQMAGFTGIQVHACRTCFQH